MATRLAAHAPLTLPTSGLRRAAVLVPLRPALGEGSGLEIILTRRAGDLTAHAGQVAFPGGRLEPDDPGPEAAALRETEEELGTPRQELQIVGRLDDMVTVTGYHIVPVVAHLSREVPIVPSAREVARVFAVPLADLLAPDRWQKRPLSPRYPDLKAWHFPYAGEDVWGATAAMLRGFVELLWDGPATGRDLASPG